MPMIIEQHRASLHQPAFSELLPVRDILNDVIIRTTGALVAGYELSGINSYYHNDDGRNRTKLALEALIRSLPERSMRMQVRFEIAEGLGDLRERYQQQLRNQNPTLLALDRLRMDQAIRDRIARRWSPDARRSISRSQNQITSRWIDVHRNNPALFLDRLTHSFAVRKIPLPNFPIRTASKEREAIAAELHASNDGIVREFLLENSLVPQLPHPHLGSDDRGGELTVRTKNRIRHRSVVHQAHAGELSRRHVPKATGVIVAGRENTAPLRIELRGIYFVLVPKFENGNTFRNFPQDRGVCADRDGVDRIGILELRRSVEFPRFRIAKTHGAIEAYGDDASAIGGKEGAAERPCMLKWSARRFSRRGFPQTRGHIARSGQHFRTVG